MAKLEYRFTNDALFRSLFTKHPELLKGLVAELLGISLESIEQFGITSPELPPDKLGDKLSRYPSLRSDTRDLHDKVSNSLIFLPAL